MLSLQGQLGVPCSDNPRHPSVRGVARRCLSVTLTSILTGWFLRSLRWWVMVLANILAWGPLRSHRLEVIGLPPHRLGVIIRPVRMFS